MQTIRTDLALEADELARGRGGALDGVESEKQSWDGVEVTTVTVGTERAARELGKPVGRYLTLSVQALRRREEDAFARTVRALARALTQLLPDGAERPVLVAGLGNRAITPDAIGPKAVEHVLVTRHLVDSTPEYFGSLRRVSALAPGVLGMTGVETGEILRGVLDRTRPGAVIVVDALAARRLSRLLCTIQVSDTGIVPGSGVGNARAALSQEQLGVPVLAIGVPTVVDGATLAADLTEQLPQAQSEALDDLRRPVLVTTQDIDAQVSDMARVIGYGVNLALHPCLTLEDIDLFLS